MKRQAVEIKKDGFYLNGEPFYMASGDIHYFRIHPSAWHRHFLLAKDFGLTAIQIYVPWNLHEPKKGEFDFSGILDLPAFLQMAQDYDLKVLLRPAPYICSECEFGGLPPWLLFDEKVRIRCSEPTYLAHVKDYYKVLIEKIRPYLYTNGGPVIMVALENEYGGAGYDKKYMQFIADTLTELGIDVPFYTTDGSATMLHLGSLPNVFVGSNFRSNPGTATHFADFTERDYSEFPFFVGEFWSGRAIYWGEPYQKRDPMPTAQAYAESLERGALNFYMFSGGTNFGMFSGAAVGKSFTPRPDTPVRYIAHVTSYDEDALVSENGLPTEKYYLCRDVLDKHLGKPKRTDRTLPFAYETQNLTIPFTQMARLFDNIDVLTEAQAQTVAIEPMEYLEQMRGLTLYTTEVEGWETAGMIDLKIAGVHDRATVYDGETYLGMVVRDREQEPLYWNAKNRTAKLNILVESLARINCGMELDNDRKGITRYVQLDCAKLYHWNMRALPLEDISSVAYQPFSEEKVIENDPIFYKATFDAKADTDTFLDMQVFGHGFVWINGFNIGRFWNIGPQYTLYVPGGLLKDKDNVIEVLDINPKKGNTKICGVSEHNLENLN